MSDFWSSVGGDKEKEEAPPPPVYDHTQAPVGFQSFEHYQPAPLHVPDINAPSWPLSLLIAYAAAFISTIVLLLVSLVVGFLLAFIGIASGSSVQTLQLLMVIFQLTAGLYIQTRIFRHFALSWGDWQLSFVRVLIALVLSNILATVLAVLIFFLAPPLALLVVLASPFLMVAILRGFEAGDVSN